MKAIIKSKPVVNPVEGQKYFNTYDGKIWEYKPIPCPLPFWGNPETLRAVVAEYDEPYFGGIAPKITDVHQENLEQVVENQLIDTEKPVDIEIFNGLAYIKGFRVNNPDKWKTSI